MKQHRIIAIAISLALPLILSLALVATVAAQNQNENPSGLTAELCGDAVCLSWIPGAGNFDVQQILIWQGTSLEDKDNGRITRTTRNYTEARVPLDTLNLEPTENAGETVAYSFQVVAISVNDINVPNGYSNHVTLHIPRPVIEAPPAGPVDPYGLTAELCGDAVCLSWTPGTGYFEHQVLLGWEGTDIAYRHQGFSLDVDSDSEARLPLRLINLKPLKGTGTTVLYSFQVVGRGLFGYSTEFSNQATLRLTRPIIGENTKELIDPSGLSVERCGDSVCLSWTPGSNYAYQGIRFWKTGDPDNASYHGGVLNIRPNLSEWQFTAEQMNRRHPDDNGIVSYTFRVEADTRNIDNIDHIGYSNEVTLEVSPLGTQIVENFDIGDINFNGNNNDANTPES